MENPNLEKEVKSVLKSLVSREIKELKENLALIDALEKDMKEAHKLTEKRILEKIHQDAFNFNLNSEKVKKHLHSFETLQELSELANQEAQVQKTLILKNLKLLEKVIF